MSEFSYIPRRVTRQGDKGEERLLSDWRTEPAYVLLGDPGAGKTSALKQEAKDAGKPVIQARQLVAGELPDGVSAPFFVDALDEAFACNPATDVISIVMAKLRKLGGSFRITCREMDWQATQAGYAIKSQSGDSAATILHLCPLREQDIVRALRDRGAPDPEAFLLEARQRGLSSLLGNPLLLDLLWRAVRAGGEAWPASRKDLFDRTCRLLAKEHSLGHGGARARFLEGVTAIRQRAGWLFSILLLGHKRALSRQDASYADVIAIDELDNTPSPVDIQPAISSKLFASDGDGFAPRHRTIAEFEAGREIARLVTEEGLPLERVLALSTAPRQPPTVASLDISKTDRTSGDRAPHPDLRGLLAWIAAHSTDQDRRRLLRLDPLGFVANADTTVLTGDERAVLLQRIAELLDDDPWLLQDHWHSHPFGPLATRDQLVYFTDKLQPPAVTLSDTEFRRCLLMALAHAPFGHEMPELADRLKVLATEPCVPGMSDHAFHAWHRHAKEPTRTGQLRSWIEQLRSHAIADANHELLANVLDCAFPSLLGTEVLEFLPAPGQFHHTRASFFWATQFVDRIPPQMLKSMLEAISERLPDGVDASEASYHTRHVAHQLVARALAELADCEAPERICHWLDLLVDTVGASHGGLDSLGAIVRWLEAHPERMKEIAAAGLRLAQDGDYWRSELRMVGARLPRDWFRWLMHEADLSSDSSLVRWMIERVGRAILEGRNGFDLPTAAEVEDWVAQLGQRHPDAAVWLRLAWSTPADAWQRERHRNQERHRARLGHARELRRQSLFEHLALIETTPLPVNVLHHVARAHEKVLHDIHGEEPMDRVMDILGGTREEASRVLLDLDSLLQRSALPNFEDVLKAETQGKEYPCQFPLLLAAKRSHERDREACIGWSDALGGTLVASWLVSGSGTTPDWFTDLATKRPDLVARVFVRYAIARLRKSKPGFVRGLDGLSAREPWHTLAPRILPDLLRALPTRISAATRGLLNRDLLPALDALPVADAKQIVTERLAKLSGDWSQRVSWLVALLRFDPAAMEMLGLTLGKRPTTERRAVILGTTLDEQNIRGFSSDQLTPQVASGLIKAIAPITNPERRAVGVEHGIDEEDRRERLIRTLIDSLVTSSAPGAEQHLQALLEAPMLRPWQVYISFALSTRRRRPTTSSPPTTAEVVQLLANGPPASPDDLVALMIDHLQALSRELLGNPEYAVKLFYTDQQTHKSENDCRDILLPWLRERLKRQQVEITSEARAANDKRKDLEVMAWNADRQFSVPIEIKGDWNNEVWTAWRTQLPRYTNDPRCSARAIYLVLWFGKDASRRGIDRHLTSAVEARRWLEERVSEDDQGGTIKVCVLDLTMTKASR